MPVYQSSYSQNPTESKLLDLATEFILGSYAGWLIESLVGVRTYFGGLSFHPVYGVGALCLQIPIHGLSGVILKTALLGCLEHLAGVLCESVGGPTWSYNHPLTRFTGLESLLPFALASAFLDGDKLSNHPYFFILLTIIAIVNRYYLAGSWWTTAAH